jgi:hypothetical protein
MNAMRLSQTTRLYVGSWITVAMFMGALLGFAEYRRHPLHDPDQAWQRTGVLLPAQTYPSPTVGGEPRPGQRAVFFFARSLTDHHLFHDLADQSDLSRAADLIVVTPDGSRPVIESGIRHFAKDADGSLATAFGLRRPIDGGPPVGYALVDSHGYIRFRTLDLEFEQRAWEIKLLLGGLP